MDIELTGGRKSKGPKVTPRQVTVVPGHLPLYDPTPDEKAAMTASDSPSSTNEFLTASGAAALFDPIGSSSASQSASEFNANSIQFLQYDPNYLESYTVNDTDRVLCVNTDSNALDVYLPAATNARMLLVQNDGTLDVNLVSDGTDTINDGASFDIPRDSWAPVVCDGISKWVVFPLTLNPMYGAASPVGSVTPRVYGDRYVKTDGTDRFWESYGLTSSEWELLATSAGFGGLDE
jgi:hypothetical protein